MIGITETLQAEAATVVGDDSTSSTKVSIEQLNNGCAKVHDDMDEFEEELVNVNNNAEDSVPLRSVQISEDFLLMDEDKDVIVDPVSSTTDRLSFIKRFATRPNNLKLMFASSPANNSRSVTPSENSVDDTETTTSGSDHVDGKRRRTRISKPLDIGFRNLSYTVKTGIFRGEFMLCTLLIK